MTVGEVIFWAALFVLVGAWISRRAWLSPAECCAALAGWSLVGLVGTTLSVLVCVSTHYEHVPGDPAYCHGSGAEGVAFVGYAVLVIGFGIGAVVRREKSRESRRAETATVTTRE